MHIYLFVKMFFFTNKMFFFTKKMCLVDINTYNTMKLLKYNKLVRHIIINHHKMFCEFLYNVLIYPVLAIGLCGYYALGYMKQSEGAWLNWANRQPLNHYFGIPSFVYYLLARLPSNAWGKYIHRR